MTDQCYEDFTGESFMELIGSVGPIEAASKLIIKFDRTITTKNVRYLRYKYCNDPVGHGEDVTQETWLSAIDDIIRFSKGLKKVRYTNPIGWIFQIGRNLCDRHISVCKFREITADLNEINEDLIVVPQPSLKVLLPFSHSPVEQQMYKKELLHWIRQGFYTLNTDQQVAVALSIQGYGHKEIAAQMNISDENARQLVSRGIRNIRKYISRIAGGN